MKDRRILTPESIAWFAKIFAVFTLIFVSNFIISVTTLATGMSILFAIIMLTLLEISVSIAEVNAKVDSFIEEKRTKNNKDRK